MGAFRILVADDHPIFRFGLCSLLGSHDGWEVCGEAANGRDAVEKCRQLKPDLLILDICMPLLNGVDAARQVLRDNPEQAILVLTAVDSEQVVRDCLEAGIRGWGFKSEATDDLITAVEALQRQQEHFRPARIGSDYGRVPAESRQSSYGQNAKAITARARGRATSRRG